MFKKFIDKAWFCFKLIMLALLIWLSFSIYYRNSLLDSSLTLHKSFSSAEVERIVVNARTVLGIKKIKEIVIEDKVAVGEVVNSILTRSTYGYVPMFEREPCVVKFFLKKENINYQFFYREEDRNFYFVIVNEGYMPNRGGNDEFYFHFESDQFHKLLSDKSDGEILGDAFYGCLAR